jgi:hypothetical protein
MEETSDNDMQITTEKERDKLMKRSSEGERERQRNIVRKKEYE